VGNAAFHPTAADTGVLSYNIAAVQVVENIQRPTLTAVPIAGSYAGGIFFVDSSCADPGDNGPTQGPVNLHITLAPGRIEVTFDAFGLVSCTFAGSPRQTGQLIAFPATFECSDGSHATAVVYELRATSSGMEGRWTSPDSSGCHEEARACASRAVGRDGDAG